MEGQPPENNHEQQTQENSQGQEQPRVKTLGVRIEESLHAQLSFIAQLEGATIADEIRRALEARVEAAQTDPELVARAEAVHAEMEREAQARRQAIAGFFGQVAVTGSGEAPGSSRRGGRRRTSQPGKPERA